MRSLKYEELTRQQAACWARRRTRCRDGGRRRTGEITIDDFGKVDLRVGMVLSAERGEGRG